MQSGGKNGSYGSLEQTAVEPSPPKGDRVNSNGDEVLDIFTFDDIKLPFPDDCYIQQIRDQAGVANGPVMVNYQYARSRRR